MSTGCSRSSPVRAADDVRAVLQRVSRAEVRVDGEVVGRIGRGFVVLLGVRQGDGETQARYVAEKVAALRVFPDEAGKMNRSLIDVDGEALLVSQFTLYADTRRGRRPSFVEAAGGEEAEPLVDKVGEMLGELGVTVASGIFGAMMEVDLVNDGPVTIVLDAP